MPTIPGAVNFGPLKVTLPTTFPRNEKDLICMLLAGRLKDLWAGKLICAQLAIDDLIKETTGASGLGTLRNALKDLSSAVDSFKNASGYDQILSGINKALGGVTNVFSLGGLCPSPVRPPRIPDLLGALNQNLFGQANRILNALVAASNPSVCLGNGPRGFGLDWSRTSGTLKNLRNVIRNPGPDFSTVINAFVNNLKGQARNLRAEVKRLEKNLSDPFGLNDRRTTVGSIQRTKSISDGIKVKDKNGIEYANPTKMMLLGDTEHVLNRPEPEFVDPVQYKVVPVFDHCGVVTGYEKRVISGDKGYTGWNTVFPEINEIEPSVNPKPTATSYDYFFEEQKDGSVKLYDKDSKEVNRLNVERGKHYRIGFSLPTKQIAISTAGGVGMPQLIQKSMKVTRDRDNGYGVETLVPESGAVFEKYNELDWAVQIENPTTPNDLTWSVVGGSQSGAIAVDPKSPIVIPDEEKTYDLATATKKAWLFEKRYETAGIDYLDLINTRAYNISTRIVTPSGVTYQGSSLLRYYGYSSGGITYDPGSSYKVYEDNETIEALDAASLGSQNDYRIAKFWQPVGNGRYVVFKKYMNKLSGCELRQLHIYLTSQVSDDPIIEESGYISIATVNFDKVIVFPNDVRVRYKDNYDYKVTLFDNLKLVNSEEKSVRLTNPKIPGTTYNNFDPPIEKNLLFNLTMNRETYQDLLRDVEFELTDGDKKLIKEGKLSGAALEKRILDLAEQLGYKSKQAVSGRPGLQIPQTEFIYSSEIAAASRATDGNFADRDFDLIDPYEKRTYIYFKFDDNREIEFEITYAGG